MGGQKRNEWGMNGGVGDGKQWEKWVLWVWKDERRQLDGYWVRVVGMMKVGMDNEFSVEKQ